MTISGFFSDFFGFLSVLLCFQPLIFIIHESPAFYEFWVRSVCIYMWGDGGMSDLRRYVGFLAENSLKTTLEGFWRGFVRRPTSKNAFASWNRQNMSKIWCFLWKHHIFEIRIFDILDDFITPTRVFTSTVLSCPVQYWNAFQGCTLATGTRMHSGRDCSMFGFRSICS